jgi:hypothetical protein
MFSLKVTIIFDYLVILLAHGRVQQKEGSIFKNLLYNRINQLGLHPFLYIKTISTHYQLHFMLLSCVNFSISIDPTSSQELLQLLFNHQ